MNTWLNERLNLNEREKRVDRLTHIKLLRGECVSTLVSDIEVGSGTCRNQMSWQVKIESMIM